LHTAVEQVWSYVAHNWAVYVIPYNSSLRETADILARSNE